MHSHGPGGGLPPPPTRPTATHTHIINPAVGYDYFPPGPQLPSQPSGITALRPVPSYTAWWHTNYIDSCSQLLSWACQQDKTVTLGLTDHLLHDIIHIQFHAHSFIRWMLSLHHSLSQVTTFTSVVRYEDFHQQVRSVAVMPNHCTMLIHE